MKKLKSRQYLKSYPAVYAFARFAYLVGHFLKTFFEIHLCYKKDVRVDIS